MTTYSGTYAVPSTIPPTSITISTDLDYLIPALRLHLWDTNTPPTYANGLLKYCLVAGLKVLMPRWNSRYVPTESATAWTVSRSTEDVFSQAAPPVIQYGDERPIILAASVAFKSGKIYTSSWETISWKDDEVSYSNLAGGKMAQESLLRDIEDLKNMVPDRGKRLGRSMKQSLLGFRGPSHEFEG